MGSGDVQQLQRELGHVFENRELLERALTHSSLAFERWADRAGRAGEDADGKPRDEAPCAAPEATNPAPGANGGSPLETPEDNERLEFLGDAVIGLLTAEALWARYPELKEGDLTRLRAALVSRRHMGQVALAMGLGEYLRLGRGEERSGGRRKAVLLANTLEAVLGALYLDGGMEAARRFALRAIVDPYLDGLRRELQEGQSMGDHKSALQEMLQARKAGPPEYQVKAEMGPDHRKRFLVEVRVSGLEGTPEMRAEGSGSTKKRAEQEAARRAFARLREGKRGDHRGQGAED